VKERENEDLTRAIDRLAYAVTDLLCENKSQFTWMITHHHFATKHDIEDLNSDLTMKISEIKTIIATATRAQKEALAEIGTQVADLKKQIDDLKTAATDPDVTDAEFLTQINDLQTDAQALADIVPGTPSTEPTTPPGGETPPPTNPTDRRSA
jgi:phosphoglycerate-specific signal transduction histidine kinase